MSLDFRILVSNVYLSRSAIVWTLSQSRPLLVFLLMPLRVTVRDTKTHKSVKGLIGFHNPHLFFKPFPQMGILQILLP